VMSRIDNFCSGSSFDSLYNCEGGLCKLKESYGKFFFFFFFYILLKIKIKKKKKKKLKKKNFFFFF